MAGLHFKNWRKKMIRVFDTSDERTKNLSADDSIIFTTINCDGIERFWCASGMEELKTWWWEEDYDGPADDDEVTEFFVAGEYVWGMSKFNDVVTTYGFTEKPESFVMKFTLYEDLKGIRDSMQMDSETTVATLKTKNHFISLEVRGEVGVDFRERPEDESETYRTPSEFPQALKDLISGKTVIYREDGNVEGIEHDWTLDDRIYVGFNNWFEVFVGQSENTLYSSGQSKVVDAEGLSGNEILGMLLEIDKAYSDSESEVK